jgi:prefoldin alpha subunit
MTEDRENAERMMMEYEQYKGQIEALQEGINLIDASLIQMEATISALKNASTLTGDNEILLPVGTDSFLSAKVVDTKNAIVGIGADVAVKKSIKEAIADVEVRKTALEKNREERAAEFEKVVKAAQEMAPKIQDIVAKAQSGD